MSDDYPNRPTAREGSPETAFDAANSVVGAARSREKKAGLLIGQKAATGCTADEVADAFGWDRYSARPRLSTMRARGEIVDSGQRRRGVSGRQQAVWVLPEYGPPVAEAKA